MEKIDQTVVLLSLGLGLFSQGAAGVLVNVGTPLQVYQFQSLAWLFLGLFVFGVRLGK